MRDRADRSLLAPTTFDRVLAAGAAVLLLAVLVALARGFGQWAQLPAALWVHILTILVALALTPVMLLRPRGDRRHRRLGWVWAAALFLTAAVSFLVRTAPDGGFSVIHLLSAFTLLQVPLIIWTARTHRWARHRSAVRGMVTGALLIAGFFTFPFGRLMGTWLFG
ncbi:membrane protein [Croceibacterium mercuriale]|uniref:Membrane protein n=1 Tax=Croceibacterium mercuriale TaxID=1572751 RepID=A0A0B2BZJ8_9SPHN|nr:membrane protein [Croceibacterium mercuriale]